MMPKVLVPLAQGCEELEAVTIIDILRRAEIEVVTAGLDSQVVVASRGVKLVPDMSLEHALQEEYDMVVLPGGLGGMQNLAQDDRIGELLKQMVELGKFVGAICAAPQVLAQHGLLAGKTMTSYPGFATQEDFPGLKNTGTAVECDGKIITSRGPGTAMDFALQVVEALAGKTTRDTVEAGLVRG
jgi:4-methyl-5(b-hydroxyethyl)-thiazole monophosphate biosynthesis